MSPQKNGLKKGRSLAEKLPGMKKGNQRIACLIACDLFFPFLFNFLVTQLDQFFENLLLCPKMSRWYWNKDHCRYLKLPKQTGNAVECYCPSIFCVSLYKLPAFICYSFGPCSFLQRSKGFFCCAWSNQFLGTIFDLFVWKANKIKLQASILEKIIMVLFHDYNLDKVIVEYQTQQRA